RVYANFNLRRQISRQTFNSDFIQNFYKRTAQSFYSCGFAYEFQRNVGSQFFSHLYFVKINVNRLAGQVVAFYILNQDVARTAVWQLQFNNRAFTSFAKDFFKLNLVNT